MRKPLAYTDSGEIARGYDSCVNQECDRWQHGRYGHEAWLAIGLDGGWLKRECHYVLVRRYWKGVVVVGKGPLSSLVVLRKRTAMGEESCTQLLLA